MSKLNVGTGGGGGGQQVTKGKMWSTPPLWHNIRCKWLASFCNVTKTLFKEGIVRTKKGEPFGPLILHMLLT